MIMYKVSASDVTDFIRNRRKTIPEKEEKSKKKRGNSTQYQRFLKKYYDIEKTMDDFNSIDLVYYFREIAEENGVNYRIANIQKDARMFKILKETYENREICGMIVFLFESGQNYLKKETISPNILVSSWSNTIYADFKLWLDDKYVPKKNKQRRTREWEEDTNNENVEIGVKL